MGTRNRSRTQHTVICNQDRDEVRKKPYTLTKSKLMAWRQCEKKLWLSEHRPALAQQPQNAESRLHTGLQVGDVARTLFGEGPVIDFSQGISGAIARTIAFMDQGVERIYEPTFIHDGVLVRADILERVSRRRPYKYRLVEVKSSTSVKDTHCEDSAIQAYVVSGAQVSLRSASVAHIDSTFVYPGGGDNHGLLREVPVDDEIRPFLAQVPTWIHKANRVLRGPEPHTAVGPHCTQPYDCPFTDYCSNGPEAEYPVTLLPQAGALTQALIDEGYSDLRDVPRTRLSKDVHLRIWDATTSGRPYRDPALKAILNALDYPRYFLDFETITFAVPIWPGTRPYQQLPFQWSVHVEQSNGRLDHEEFLDTDGDGPMRACMLNLIETLGTKGPVLVYTSFEKTVLKSMAKMFPDLAPALEEIVGRLFDLHPLLRNGWYHPSQKGSWSIKQVLPAFAPDLDYSQLGISDGERAQKAYLDMINALTPASRRIELKAQLLEYCSTDTLAMVRVLRSLSATRGRTSRASFLEK